MFDVLRLVLVQFGWKVGEGEGKMKGGGGEGY